MTVKESVIRCILAHYPLVPSHKLHRCSKKHPFSSMQRLREMKAEWALRYEYDYATKCYDFEMTPRFTIVKLLDDMIENKP